MRFYKEKKYKDAWNCFYQASEVKYPDGNYMVGMMFYEGKGCENDSSRAISFLIEAAKQNHPDANYNLGHILKHNNKSKAIMFFTKAKSLGHPDAEESLKILNSGKKDSINQGIRNRRSL